MKQILILLSLMLYSGSASAMTTSEFISSFEGEEGEIKKHYAAVFIVGIGSGIRTVNRHSQMTNGWSSFCLPPELAINTENYYDILKTEYDKSPNIYKDFRVETILLYGMMSTFPCKN